MPPERVDEIIEYKIDDSEIARLQLAPTAQFETIQHIELPDSPVTVTEHRFRLYETVEGELYYAHAPEVHGQPIFGPRLLANIGWMKSRAVLEELVGEDFKGYLNFDYFSSNCSFAWIYDIKAQYCWAHLSRDMRFLLKHPDKKPGSGPNSFWIVRDGCFRQGTHSEAGQRYNERMWTAIATCKKQNKNFFDFLLKSIKAELGAEKAPNFLA